MALISHVMLLFKLCKSKVSACRFWLKNRSQQPWNKWHISHCNVQKSNQNIQICGWLFCAGDVACSSHKVSETQEKKEGKELVMCIIHQNRTMKFSRPDGGSVKIHVKDLKHYLPTALNLLTSVQARIPKYPLKYMIDGQTFDVKVVSLFYYTDFPCKIYACICL